MKRNEIIIYNNYQLFLVLDEISNEINFKFKHLNKDNFHFKDKENFEYNLIISKKKLENQKNNLIIKNFPLNIKKLVEKINIEFLKINFSEQSNISIKDYFINLNSRELTKNNIKIKLTEKEVSSIIYLFKKKKPVSIRKLEEDVWMYQFDIETHTVETHIYRLRKKIFDNFKDDKFIISTKDGYKL